MTLTGYQEDALREVINVGIGRAAASLSDLIALRIELSLPSVRLCGWDELSRQKIAGVEGASIVIAQDFDGLVSGRTALVFPQSSGLQLAQMLAGIDNAADEFDLELSGILLEVANIVLNGVLGSLANVLETNLAFSLPWFSGEQNGELLASTLADRFGAQVQHLVIADARFQVQQRAISSTLFLVFQVGGVRTLLHALCASEANT